MFTALESEMSPSVIPSSTKLKSKVYIIFKNCFKCLSVMKAKNVCLRGLIQNLY